MYEMSGPTLRGRRIAGAHRPGWLGPALLAAVVLIGSACSTAPPAGPGQVLGIGERHIDVQLSGAVSYSNSAAVTSGAAVVTYDSGSGVTELSGSLTTPGVSGGAATVTFDIEEVLGKYSGSVRVQDPTVGVDVSVQHVLAPVSFDAEGDAEGTATSGGIRIDWSIETAEASGVEPAYDALDAAEAGFCQDAQRRLSGLDDSQLEDSEIANTVHNTRAAFGGSKASLVPLGVQTWAEPEQVDTAAGNNLVISHRISCKTRAADHLATLGLPVGAPQQCSVLTERSMELARAQMTPAEIAAYDSAGRQVVTVADRLVGTGSEYLTPFADERQVGDTLEVRAGSLRTDWNDPAYALLPDTIRGVHYCTAWSPTWAYWWMTEGAFG